MDVRIGGGQVLREQPTKWDIFIFVYTSLVFYFGWSFQQTADDQKKLANIAGYRNEEMMEWLLLSSDGGGKNKTTVHQSRMGNTSQSPTLG